MEGVAGNVEVEGMLLELPYLVCNQLLCKLPMPSPLDTHSHCPLPSVINTPHHHDFQQNSVSKTLQMEYPDLSSLSLKISPQCWHRAPVKKGRHPPWILCQDVSATLIGQSLIVLWHLHQCNVGEYTTLANGSSAPSTTSVWNIVVHPWPCHSLSS